MKYLIAFAVCTAFGFGVWALYYIPGVFAYLQAQNLTLPILWGLSVGLVLGIIACWIRNDILSLMIIAIPFVMAFFNLILIYETKTGVYVFALAIFYGLMWIHFTVVNLRHNQRQRL